MQASTFSVKLKHHDTMEGDSETYLTLLEDNHWVMVKSVDPEVFLDYMQQHRVLSDEDCQVVQNYFINQTRRGRMRCFLNIIRTKGPDNIKLFFQQLGWEYPHVYREIFRQEPTIAPQSADDGAEETPVSPAIVELDASD